MKTIEDRIFTVSSREQFDELALEIFRFQASSNEVYRTYLDILGIRSESITSVDQIPFLPIEFFRSKQVVSGEGPFGQVFESSGTTGQQTSRHYVQHTSIYIESFTRTFTRFYGNPENLCILALLPSYLDRENSSLVYMMDHLIKMSGHPDSNFYLDDLGKLSGILKKRNDDKHPTILLGVSFALLDLAAEYPLNLGENITVMETGGMKGRRKELIRSELHEELKQAFGLAQVHSEYGMTELLSQAYTRGDGHFEPAYWMQVRTRDLYDPLSMLPENSSGGINIIDLANIYSCSFIATGDQGKVYGDGSFEISGRMDHSEIRGCNLMVV